MKGVAIPSFLLILQVLYTSGKSYQFSPSFLTYPSASTFLNPYKYAYLPPKSAYNSQLYITDQYGRTYLASSSYGKQVAINNPNICNTCPPEYSSVQQYVSSCGAATCGSNAHCSTVGGRPVCSCLRGYLGDPLVHCERAECLDHSECRSHQSCQAGRCVNPCSGVCGTGADCEARNHVPVCTCPPGHTGNPLSGCRRFNPEELCHPSPCGANTNCEVINNIPTCKCLPGYHGSPLAGCHHECESNSECGPSSACIEFKCKNPCSQCGTNAECQLVQNHVPVCKCPRGYYGNPLISCQAECSQHSDCPPGKPACFYNSCKNPCEGVCGVNANCELKNGLTPVCSCPRDMTGDPFVSCRPFTKADLCEPNPCGSNAKCTPGYDRTNKERPVCTCPPGYTGNPLRSCVRGECFEDAECPDHRACINYQCQNPCVNQCGVNAMCNARRHIAVCTCLPGYNGDALSQCTRIESSQAQPQSYVTHQSYNTCNVC